MEDGEGSDFGPFLAHSLDSAGEMVERKPLEDFDEDFVWKVLDPQLVIC